MSDMDRYVWHEGDVQIVRRATKSARTITISSGGKKRDDALNPIIASVKLKLIELAAYHGNRTKVQDLTTAELVTLRAGLLKFNENHDEQGRFAESGGGGLSSAETSALVDYTGGSFSAINRTLRGGTLAPDDWHLIGVDPKETAEQIKAIDSAMAHSRLPEMTVHRGAGGFDSFSRDEVLTAPGTAVRDNGFLSTAKDRGFTSSLNNFRLTIDIPAGTRGIDLSTTINRAESEVLLDRGVGLRVDSVTAEPITGDPYRAGESNYLIHATVVP